MTRRTALAHTRAGNQADRYPDLDDTTLNDEPVHVVRWSRIWIGLTLIAVAIVWIAIDNVLGVGGTTSSTTPVTRPQVQAPSLGTVQYVEGRAVNAKLLLHRTHDILIAVQVTNETTAPLRVTAASFSLRGHGTPVTGRPYGSHPAPLFTAPLAPRARLAGVLDFPISSTSGSATLIYRPSAPTGVNPLVWLIP